MMNGKKNIVLDPIKFGFRTLVKHIGLFAMMVLVSGIIIAAVVFLIKFLIIGFCQDIITSGALSNFQDCIARGDCFSVAAESAVVVMGFVKVYLLHLLVSACLAIVTFCGLYLGLNKIALDLAEKGNSSVQTLFACFSMVPRTFAALVIYSLTVSIGMLLLVIPGIFIAIRCSLFPYFIIDQNAGAVEALKMSYRVTKNHMWHWILLCIVVSIITGIPKMLLTYFDYQQWIGFIFSGPFSALVYAYFYRTLVTEGGNRLSDAS